MQFRATTFKNVNAVYRKHMWSDEIFQRRGIISKEVWEAPTLFRFKILHELALSLSMAFMRKDGIWDYSEIRNFLYICPSQSFPICQKVSLFRKRRTCLLSSLRHPKRSHQIRRSYNQSGILSRISKLGSSLREQLWPNSFATWKQRFFVIVFI